MSLQPSSPGSGLASEAELGVSVAEHFKEEIVLGLRTRSHSLFIRSSNIEMKDGGISFISGWEIERVSTFIS